MEPVGQINVPKKPEIYKDIPDPAGDQVLLSEAEQLERVVRTVSERGIAVTGQILYWKIEVNERQE